MITDYRKPTYCNLKYGWAAHKTNKGHYAIVDLAGDIVGSAVKIFGGGFTLEVAGRRITRNTLELAVRELIAEESAAARR